MCHKDIGFPGSAEPMQSPDREYVKSAWYYSYVKALCPQRIYSGVSGVAFSPEHQQDRTGG